MNRMLIEMIEEDDYEENCCAAEYGERYSHSSSNAMKLALLHAGVNGVFVKENHSFKSQEGVAAMSLSIFVNGGDLETIYKTIRDNKPVGIATNGDVDILGIKFFLLTDMDYETQEKLVDKVVRKLRREELLKELEELEYAERA